MNTETLIYETIHHGSIFEAMEYNFFSCQELVDYLAKNADSIPIEKLYLSFAALMKYYPSIYHYSNGKHILSYLPSDNTIHRIFILLGGSPELPVSKDDLTNSLWSLVFDMYSEYMNDEWSEDVERCMLLCNKITIKLSKKELIFKEPEFLSMLYQYRCDKVISMLPLCDIPSKDTIQYSIDSDWFDQYPHISKWYRRYIEHVEKMKTSAPLYFEKMTEQYMYQLCMITLREFERIDLDLLKKTAKCFPQQFSNIDVSDCYQRVGFYPIGVRTYILGLPCFPNLPSHKKLDECLVTLSEMGVDRYVEMVLKRQDVESIPEDRIANAEDTLFEKPESYVSIDRLNIEENGKIYQFTRPEFKKLLSDKRNFWTKQKLSFSDLYTLQLRSSVCMSLNLPPSDTFKILLEKACEGRLYEEPLTKESPPQTSETSMNQSLLYLYNIFLNNPNAFMEEISDTN